jgi:hypothetical protein
MKVTKAWKGWNSRNPVGNNDENEQLYREVKVECTRLTVCQYQPKSVQPHALSGAS